MLTVISNVFTRQFAAKALDWLGLYLILVFTSATVYWAVSGVPYWKAICGGLVVNLLKVPICKGWHAIMHPKKKPVVVMVICSECEKVA